MLTNTPPRLPATMTPRPQTAMPAPTAVRPAAGGIVAPNTNDTPGLPRDGTATPRPSPTLPTVPAGVVPPRFMQPPAQGIAVGEPNPSAPRPNGPNGGQGNHFGWRNQADWQARRQARMAQLQARFGDMQNLPPGAKAIIDARMQTNRTPR